MPTTIWERHKGEMQREVKEIQNMGCVPRDGSDQAHIVLRTEDGKCVFLKDNLDCAIYEDRPWICRKFGDESCGMLTCSWKAKDGRIRSRQEKRKIERAVEKGTNSLAKKFRLIG